MAILDMVELMAGNGETQVLGRAWFPAAGRYGEYVTYDGPAAGLIFGTPGSGKTVRALAPMLLGSSSMSPVGAGDPQSYIFIDTKGQLTALAYDYRRSLGNFVVVDPYGIVARFRPDIKTTCSNVLLDPEPTSPDFADDCQALGIGLVRHIPNESQPFFRDAARSFATGGIAGYVRAARREGKVPTLPELIEILLQEPEALKKTIEEWVRDGDFTVRSNLNKFLAKDSESTRDVRATFEAAVQWIASEKLRDDLSADTCVRWAECTRRPMTIALVLPPHELRPKGDWLRLQASAGARQLFKTGGGSVKTTIIAKEAYVLGRMDVFLDLISVGRDYNFSITTVFQSLQQLKELYSDTWQLFLSGTVLCFRPGSGDLETAEYFAKRAGKHFVAQLSASDPTAPSDDGPRPSWGPVERERLAATKILSLPDGHALALLPGEEEIVPLRADAYFEVPRLKDRAGVNPYYRGAAAPPPVRKRNTVPASTVALLLAALAGVWACF